VDGGTGPVLLVVKYLLLLLSLQSIGGIFCAVYNHSTDGRLLCSSSHLVSAAFQDVSELFSVENVVILVVLIFLLFSFFSPPRNESFQSGLIFC